MSERDDMPELPYPALGRNSKGVELFAADQMHAYARAYAEQRVREEREACAQVCESRATPGTASVAILNGAADAIRGRSA